MQIQRPQILVISSIELVALLALSGAHPFDRTTWLLEVLPVFIVLPVLWLTYDRFPLTNILYILIY